MGSTVRSALSSAAARLEAAGVPSPEWDASLLLSWVLGVARSALLLDATRSLTGEELGRFQRAVDRRAKREPLQYITGSQGFMGLEVAVDHRVLVPRPETEILVEAALQHLAALPGDGPLRAADIGTGSGAIAVALAFYQPRLTVAAMDLSPEALEVAAGNARRNGVADRMELLQGDLLAPVRDRQFDLLVSNPPYIDPAEAGGLMPEVAEYEPALALYSPAGPLAFYDRLTAEARSCLQPGGLMAVEVGLGQAEPVARHLATSWRLRRAPTDGAGLAAHLAPPPEPGTVQVRLDYSGLARVVLARLEMLETSETRPDGNRREGP